MTRVNSWRQRIALFLYQLTGGASFLPWRKHHRLVLRTTTATTPKSWLLHYTAQSSNFIVASRWRGVEQPKWETLEEDYQGENRVRAELVVGRTVLGVQRVRPEIDDGGIKKELKTGLSKAGMRVDWVDAADWVAVVTTDPRHGRAYRESTLEAVPEQLPGGNSGAKRPRFLHWRSPAPPATRDRDLQLKLYSEICSSWRMLTDVRFKLLALVPVISGLGLASLVSDKGPLEGAGPLTRVFGSMFGLLATIALYIYEIRNSDLYDDLISRGRRIEYELGVDTGHFRGRPKPASWLVTHGTAIKLVYLVTIAAWGAAVIAVTRQLISAQ